MAPVLAISALTLTPHTTVTAGAARARAEITRKIYIAATDAKGAFVTDLTAADVTIKEGGKAYPVSGLLPATAPMQIVVLVDDNALGGLQAAVAQFLQKTLGRGQFAISLLSPAAMKVVDFTDDFEALKTAITRLGPRGRQQPDGDQLPTAIADAAKMLQQRKAERPVIVVFTISGAELKSVDPNYIVSTIRTTGVALDVVAFNGAELGQVMLDGPKQSGGLVEQGGTAATLSAAATKIADLLLHQYVVTYTLPDGVKMSDKIAVATSRKGIELIAPSRIADK